MNYLQRVAGLLALSLTACGVNESLSTKTFNMLDEFPNLEKLAPSKCSSILEFENISFERNCWSISFKDKSEGGEIGLKLGLVLQEVHDGKLEIIEQSESQIVSRLKTKDSCANYLLTKLNDEHSLGNQTLPGKIEIIVASTKIPHCSNLSRNYRVIEG